MRKTFFSLLTIGAMVAGFIACKEEVQYDIEIDNPKTTLTVGEKIDIKITSQPEGLDLSAVEYEFSPEGIIEASHTDNGFRLVAKKKGTTTLTISCGKFEEKIPFTVKAKPNNNNGSSDSESSSGGSSSGSSSSDSDSGGGSSSSDDDSSSEGEKTDDGGSTKPDEETEEPTKPETPEEPADTTKTEPETPAEPKKVTLSFNAGENGYFKRKSEWGWWGDTNTKKAEFSGKQGENINLEEKLKVEAKQGWEFIGWDKELSETFTEDMEFTARYEVVELPKGKIIFQSSKETFNVYINNKTEYEVEGVVGTSFDISNAPTVTIYTKDARFKEWQNLPKTFTEETQYVTTVFEKKVFVTFSCYDSGFFDISDGGGTVSIYRIEGFPGEKLEPKIPNPKAGYKFDKWLPNNPSTFPDKDQSYTASFKEDTRATGSTNGHDWVNLGLPRKTRWATCNVGANTPEENGDHYAWGEVKPSVLNFEYFDVSFSKYGIRSTLKPQNDVATQEWGISWKIPTEYDFEELIKECYWKKVKKEGYVNIIGYRIYKVKNDSHKGKMNDAEIDKLYNDNDLHIFLPAAGVRNAEDFGGYIEGAGAYWTNKAEEKKWAYSLFFNANTKEVVSRYYRVDNFSIRPVLR